jgi:hypothetical protein
MPGCRSLQVTRSGRLLEPDTFRTWLDEAAPPGRPVVLIGFSGGAVFAGGLILEDPGRASGDSRPRGLSRR